MKLYTIETPEYLRKQKDFQKIIARFRCRNEEFRNKFWREQEKNMCRICQSKDKTVKHLVATNCIIEIRNSTRMNQLFRKKGKEESAG